MALDRLSWKYFLSPQEERLLGSSPKSEYMEKPHVPIAVQDGWDPEVVNYIRQKTKTFEASDGYFIYENGNIVEAERGLIDVLLSPLNTNTGETIHDPRALDEKIKIKPDKEANLRQ